MHEQKHCIASSKAKAMGMLISGRIKRVSSCITRQNIPEAGIYAQQWFAWAPNDAKSMCIHGAGLSQYQSSTAQVN